MFDNTQRGRSQQTKRKEGKNTSLVKMPLRQKSRQKGFPRMVGIHSSHAGFTIWGGVRGAKDNAVRACTSPYFSGSLRPYKSTRAQTLYRRRIEMLTIWLTAKGCLLQGGSGWCNTEAGLIYERRQASAVRKGVQKYFERKSTPGIKARSEEKRKKTANGKSYGGPSRKSALCETPRANYRGGEVLRRVGKGKVKDPVHDRIFCNPTIGKTKKKKVECSSNYGAQQQTRKMLRGARGRSSPWGAKKGEGRGG